MSINLNIIIFLWKHLQGPQILPQTEGVNLIMLAQVNDVCPLSSVLTNSKTPPLIVTDRNGSVFFNYSIDVNSVNVLNGHVHFNVQVKSQLKFLFSWNVLSVFVQQATSLLCCVFVCKCVCEQYAYVKVLFAAILPLPFVTLHQKKKMQAWPVFWAHRKGLSRSRYISGY